MCFTEGDQQRCTESLILTFSNPGKPDQYDRVEENMDSMQVSLAVFLSPQLGKLESQH